MILVSGATATTRRIGAHERLGVLFTPQGGNYRVEPAGPAWAADNGAFRGFDAVAFERMLDTLHQRALPNCLFVVAPDVVADHQGTMRLFEAWAPRLRRYGWPVAFVAQDGVTVATLPWAECDAVFIGGSTEFKLSETALALGAYAKARGHHLHVGRVNTKRRIAHFSGLADTVDGSRFSQWPDIAIPLGLRWVQEAEQQPTLWR